MAYQKLQVSRAIDVIASATVNIPNPGALSISSTTDGASALKLIDSAGDFINKGVKVGDIVYSGSIAAHVTSIDSATQLGVTTAVASGQAYKVFRSTENPNNGCVLYIGGAGNLQVLTAGGDTIVFTGVLAGTFLPVQVVRVLAASTTATGIIGLW